MPEVLPPTILFIASPTDILPRASVMAGPALVALTTILGYTSARYHQGALKNKVYITYRSWRVHSMLKGHTMRSSVNLGSAFIRVEGWVSRVS